MNYNIRVLALVAQQGKSLEDIKREVTAALAGAGYDPHAIRVEDLTA